MLHCVFIKGYLFSVFLSQKLRFFYPVGFIVHNHKLTLFLKGKVNRSLQYGKDGYEIAFSRLAQQQEEG